MKRKVGSIRLAALASLTIFAALVVPAAASAGEADLELYSATVDEGELGTLTVGGYDIAAAEPAGDATRVDLVLSAGERAELEREGLEVELVRDPQGRTASQRAAAQAAGGFDVWRDYDGPDGIARELRRVVRNHPEIAQLHVLGETHQGRKILAVRLTRNPDANPVGSRPSVLYQGTTHAREWISTEVTRRLLRHFVNGSDSSDSVRRMLQEREMWFVPVVNPDGYQYTFDQERLWRKNLRDNNGDGQITVGDGVDLNRNYPEHWNYEDEGSSSEPSSDTYRGPAAASEPETQANMELVEQIPFSFALTYHSYGRLLLYPEGWQVQTPSRDDPIYQALTGTDAEPAVPGFDPDLAAELYTVNGDFTDWAHGEQETLAWTPELAQGCRGCGFVFPDNEDRVQKEFEDNLPFALDLVRSARRPAKPHSHLGNTTEPFYLETVSGDETRAHNPGSDFRFSLSYGDPQPVEVLAKRSLGEVDVHYRINGGAEQTAATSEWDGGEAYGERHDVYYHQLRGEVTGTDPGDEVEVWFEGGDKRSESFTYTAASESGA